MLLTVIFDNYIVYLFYFLKNLFSRSYGEQAFKLNSDTIADKTSKSNGTFIYNWICSAEVVKEQSSVNINKSQQSGKF